MSDNFVVATFEWDEFRELLGVPDGKGIERVTVSYSPMMEEWSMIADLFDPEEGE